MAVLLVKGALPKRYVIKSVKLETPVCVMCHKQGEIELDYEKVMRWANGEHAQNVFPELSPDERELLISGTHPECWEQLRPPDDEV